MGCRIGRAFAVLCAAAALSGFLAFAGSAQDNYPSQGVKFVVAFAAGGPTDAIARIFSQRLTEKWGHGVVVENRGGAGGNIAARQVAKAEPNGYTVLVTTSAYRRQPDAQRQSRLRARDRLQDRGRGWHHAQRHRRQSWAQGLQSQGAGRAGEGREDDLRHARRGHHAAPVGGEVLQGARQGRRARCAVHGRRAATERPRRRPCRRRLPCAAADHRAHQERGSSKPWP